MLQKMEVDAYLIHCESRLAQEHERNVSYLRPTTRAPLIAAVESGLLESHIGMLITKN